MRIGIIGAGMAGLLSAIELKKAGFDDIVVYEKADGVGGTWRQNSYPGLACDVPSQLYSYSFALNPEWSALFAPGSELRAYFEQVAEEHDVYPLIEFGHEIVDAIYNDGHWQLTARANGEVISDQVHVLIAATGVLHHPKMPVIDGMDDFAGASFHSAQYDNELDLAGARVGVIGTGSTAVQMTTALVDKVGSFSLFQRTPQWVLQMPNAPFDDDTKQMFRDDPGALRSTYEYLSERFNDGFANSVIDAGSEQLADIAQQCLDNLENNVADDELREALRPDYIAACKRLVISPNFYESIQHENAHLVTSAIDRVEAGGVRTADGVLHELDVLVYATGYHVDAFMRPMNVVGRDGVQLDETWAERPFAYLSISIPEFPNLFMLNGPNGPVGNFSLIEVAETQMRYIMVLIELLKSGQAREISADVVATQALEVERIQAAQKTVWVTGCRSWYLDDQGVPMVWPFGHKRFVEEMAAPKLDAYDIR